MQCVSKVSLQYSFGDIENEDFFPSVCVRFLLYNNNIMKTIMLRTVCLLFTVLFLQYAVGQKSNIRQLVEIEIVPDHPDWTYRVGEDVVFSLRVVRANVPLTDINLTYEIGPEKMPPLITGQSDMKEGMIRVKGGTMQTPGFMTCTCKVEIGGQMYVNYLNVAFSPFDIEPTQTMPADFLKFWEKAKRDAAKIPMEPIVTLMPELCTSRTNVYHVRLQHYRKDTYIYGMLCVPKRQGSYPALLSVPGAGVKRVPPELELAEIGDGMITFAIGINGLPQTLDKEVYDDLRYGVLRDYAFIHLDDKDNYYYRRVYTGCIRALDFITSLPECDGENIGVIGASQGGALSIVTAALDSRVKALVAYHPALCDVTGYLYGRAGGWPHMFAPKNEKLNNKPDKIETTRYYDVVNFARILKVPGYYSWGYNDPTCPPTSYYAAYNAIEAPKNLYVAHMTGHWRIPEQNAITYRWLYDMLAKKK